MFVRAKSSRAYQYLQVVENERINGRVRQRVVATLGRLDVLQTKGHADWPDQFLRSFRSEGLCARCLSVPDEPFVIRTQTRGGARQALQAVGVALGPTVRPVSGDKP